MAAVRDPGLGAVDHVAVALEARSGHQSGRIRAALRLGQAVGTEQLAAEQVGQPAVLLCVGAVGRQGKTRQHVDAYAHGDGRPGPTELLEHLQIDLVGLSPSAVPLLIRQPQQAGPTQGAEQLAREFRPLLHRRRLWGDLAVHDVAHQPQQRLGLGGGQAADDGGHSDLSSGAGLTPAGYRRLAGVAGSAGDRSADAP